MLELFGALAISSIVLFVLSFFFFTFVKIEGYSMVPTLRDGDVVYVNKIAKVKSFDIVSIKREGMKESEVRRVIGLPGQIVTYKNDELRIDGEVKEEPFIRNEQQTAIENGRLFTEDLSILSLTGKTEIPEGSYFVLGDNRPYSTDSRTYGLVDAEEITGVVEMRIFPLHLMRTI